MSDTYISTKNKNENYLIKFASYASVLAALTIIIIKFVAWILTGSLTILATLADSMLDVVSSVINLIAIKYAMQPPDNEHRFGHGKAEDLAVFTQSAFFGVSGIFLIIAAVKKLFLPEQIQNSSEGIAIMIISTLITSLLVIIQKYVIKRTGSQVISADYMHYSIDLLTNLAVIIALVLARYLDTKFIDPIVALGIAIYVIYGAWQLLSKAFRNLMDHEFEDHVKERIHEIAVKNYNVQGIHDLKTRYAGTKPFIQFHIQLNGSMTLSKAHEISNEIETDILKEFPDADIIIHQDPDDVDEDVAYPSIV
ncbi:MAG: cation diffusion facilitator family transporter [Alphaproteobacteria bacterium]